MSGKRLKFLVGVNTGYVTDGKPDKRFIEFYKRRSSPELHCAIVGNVVIPDGYGSNNSTPTISHAHVWRDVSREIAQRGSLPGIQLATAWKGYIGSKSFRAPSAKTIIEQSRELMRSFGLEGSSVALNALEQASHMAAEAGFKHLQVHAAHGYLFSLLIDERLNEHAGKVLEQLASWAVKWSNASIETSIRISLRTGDDEFDENGQDRFHAQVAGLPFDFVDLSSGFYNIDKRLIYPGRPDILQARRAETIAVASRFPQQRFIFSGRALLKSDQDLPSNLHIGICRDLIANPDYLTNTHKGCMNAGKCHYFSRGAKHIFCAQWMNTD